jgi:hypothetical protein
MRDVTGAISPFNKSSDVGITHKENLSVRNLSTSYPLCVRRVTYISIMRICAQVVTAECMKGCYICMPCSFFFCPLVIYRLSFISLSLQRLCRLFSRVLNATSRRLGWRHRVFVCYVYRCGLILLTPRQLPAASCHYTRFAQSI